MSEIFGQDLMSDNVQYKIQKNLFQLTKILNLEMFFLWKYNVIKIF